MMKYRITRVIVILPILFIAWDCVTETIPIGGVEETFNQTLLIQTDSSRYDNDSIAHGSLIFIYATLRNPSADTFYSRLGDGFNSTLDQGILNLAEGTDGRFQKLTGNKTWLDIPRGMLIEGTRTVRLLPTKEFSLRATAIRDSVVPGTFRLKIDYFRDSARVGSDTLRDTSNTFTIY